MPQLDTFTAWDVYIARQLYRTLSATMTAATTARLQNRP
jgi:hypothetical protein